jgi:hypothetical protein
MSIERQIRIKLSCAAKPFPCPVHANLKAEALAGVKRKAMEQINFVQSDRPPGNPVATWNWVSTDWQNPRLKEQWSPI